MSLGTDQYRTEYFATSVAVLIVAYISAHMVKSYLESFATAMIIAICILLLLLSVEIVACLIKHAGNKLHLLHGVSIYILIVVMLALSLRIFIHEYERMHNLYNSQIIEVSMKYTLLSRNDILDMYLNYRDHDQQTVMEVIDRIVTVQPHYNKEHNQP